MFKLMCLVTFVNDTSITTTLTTLSPSSTGQHQCQRLLSAVQRPGLCRVLRAPRLVLRLPQHHHRGQPARLRSRLRPQGRRPLPTHSQPTITPLNILPLPSQATPTITATSSSGSALATGSVLTVTGTKFLAATVGLGAGPGGSTLSAAQLNTITLVGHSGLALTSNATINCPVTTGQSTRYPYLIY